MEKKTALIVGATGLVGKFCLSYLLMDEQYEKVIVLTRREIPYKDPKLQQVIIDFDKLEEHRSQLRADDVFCCLGTTINVAGSKENFRKVDFGYPVAVARLAKEQGAAQIMVVSAMGADKNSSVFYSRVKGEMEEALKSLDFGALHLFRPSLLTGMRKEFRLGERFAQSVMRIFSFLLIGPVKKYKPIDAMVVAYAMVFKAKSGSKGTFIYPSDQIQEIFNIRNKQV